MFLGDSFCKAVVIAYVYYGWCYCHVADVMPLGCLFEADVITSIDMADVIACLFMADVIAIEADVITSIDKADVISHLFLADVIAMWLMLCH